MICNFVSYSMFTHEPQHCSRGFCFVFLSCSYVSSTYLFPGCLTFLILIVIHWNACSTELKQGPLTTAANPMMATMSLMLCACPTVCSGRLLVSLISMPGRSAMLTSGREGHRPSCTLRLCTSSINNITQNVHNLPPCGYNTFPRLLSARPRHVMKMTGGSILMRGA